MATNWRRGAVASAAAWLPLVLVGVSVAVALFAGWWITGTQAAVVFLAAWWPWLLISAAAVVVLSVFVWWLWWRLPKRQVERLRHAIRDPKARTDVEDNFRKTAGQLLGGAAVLIGAAAAYLQFQQQQISAHDLLISNQVSKGFDQLGQGGNDKVAVRLGGIYALEGVMNSSQQYHQPVLEALCAFVRDDTKNKTGDDRLATDVQAALTVIRRREPGHGTVDLSGARTPKANLSYADLDRADLSDANLTGANLTGAKLTSANLKGADLSHVNLTITDLIGADLTGANLTGATLLSAHLEGADLRGARGLTQEQLDKACASSNKPRLDPPLTFRAQFCIRG